MTKQNVCRTDISFEKRLISWIGGMQSTNRVQENRHSQHVKYYDLEIHGICLYSRHARTPQLTRDKSPLDILCSRPKLNIALVHVFAAFEVPHVRHQHRPYFIKSSAQLLVVHR